MKSEERAGGVWLGIWGSSEREAWRMGRLPKVAGLLWICSAPGSALKAQLGRLLESTGLLATCDERDKANRQKLFCSETYVDLPVPDREIQQVMCVRCACVSSDQGTVMASS